MSIKNDIVIQDACILIDLVDLDLIDDFHRLDLTVFTTKIVIEEITDEEQFKKISGFIEKGILHIDVEGDDEAIRSMFDEVTGLSLADCSVLEFAARKHCVVLSADKRLRNECRRKNMDVRGLLWIVEELCSSGIITIDLAVEKLKEYPQLNKRAPTSEIEKLILKLIGS